MVGPWLAGAAILAAWLVGLIATRKDVYDTVPDTLHLIVLVIAGLVAGAVASRRGARFGRSIKTGALLAVVPAAFAGVLEWTSKPSMIIAPSGPTAAPFAFLAVLALAMIPAAAGTAVGWGVARRLSAWRSSRRDSIGRTQR